MQRDRDATDAQSKTEQLAQLARMQGITLAPEALSALAQQLTLLEDLEIAQLQDEPPALKMDAAWHD